MEGTINQTKPPQQRMSPQLSLRCQNDRRAEFWPQLAWLATAGAGANVGHCSRYTAVGMEQTEYTFYESFIYKIFLAILIEGLEYF